MSLLALFFRRSSCRRGFVVPVLTTLLLFLFTPNGLFGQQADTAVSLEPGDRVRVWSSDARLDGEGFDFRGWKADSLILMEPDTIDVTRLSRERTDSLQVQRETGGTHVLEGALIGGGIGLVPIAVLSARRCAGPDFQGGAGCTIGFMLGGPALLGIVPGGLIGGAIGLAFPEREWVNVEIWASGGPGLGIAVEIKMPN